MIEAFHVTSIGYSHVKSGKVCQDHSSAFSDGERAVITACDGHGGEIYIRSHKGSQFASHAMLRTMLSVESLLSRKCSAEELANNLKLNVLCEWNRLVREDLTKHPIRKSEVKQHTEEQINILRKNPVKAYGSTLTGAMQLGSRLFCVQLGDGGCFLLRSDGKIVPAFSESEDEPVANLTYSLCGEDAFSHMHAAIFDMRQCDGVLLCTDGILASYQTIENFKRYFMRPVIHHASLRNTREITNFVQTLGTRSGVGDDVSLAMILKTKIKAKNYK